METQTERQRDRQTDRQTDRQAGRQAGRHAGRQAGRQTDRQIVDPPETTQGSFKVGRGAKGGLLVLAVVSLQSLIPPVQLLVPAFLHPPQSSLRLERALSTRRSALVTVNCSM